MKKCVICGNSAEIHHLMTQKAYPELKDKPWNQLPTCRMHHSEFHNSGIGAMAEHYFAVKVWLKNNSWVYCEVKRKYVPPSYS
jgi:hypothetical protein